MVEWNDCEAGMVHMDVAHGGRRPGCRGAGLHFTSCSF